MNNVRGKNTRRKHLNKNKKKSWRKVNIDELEDFLEDERLQERTGGLVAEKTNESLFFVDTKKKKKSARVTRETRKRKAKDDMNDIEVTLKPPPSKKKDKRIAAVIEKEADGKLSNKQKESFQQRKIAKQERYIKTVTRTREAVANFDLWGDTLENEEKKDDEHFLKVTRTKRIKAPERLRNKVSLIPAVEAPHPGASYNPAYEDYQALLQKAHDVEEAARQQELKIKRAMYDKFPTPDQAPTEASVLEEMSAGLYEESGAESDEDVGDLEKLSVNPPVRRENKKDERRRKKEKARMEEAKIKEQLKEKRVLDNNFYRLRSIKSELKTRDVLLKSRVVKREAKKEKEKYMTKRLSKIKYEEPKIDVKLSDDLTGSLRELRPEGHLLVDRYQSLMKRNILEPRGAPGKTQKKKYKPKVFEKKSHKEIK